jgi:hypothetical protein
MTAQTVIETVGAIHRCPTTVIKAASNINLEVIPRAVAGSLCIWKFDHTISGRFNRRDDDTIAQDLDGHESVQKENHEQ